MVTSWSAVRSIDRQRSGVAGNGIAVVPNGQAVTVIGTIQTIPPPEEMTSWGLTSRDKADLAGRPIYIRADIVVPAV